jgi:hypothetical protein
MKLTRIEDSDIFYFADDGVRCIGEVLIEGSFEVVFEYALQLRNEPNIDLGSGDSVTVDSALAMTNIIDAKWYLIYLNLEVNHFLIQIVRTSGRELYSLPTGFETYQEPLINIFTRISNLVND